MDTATLYTAIGSLFLLVLRLHRQQLDCSERRVRCEERSNAQQRQIDALIEGDPDRARSARHTEPLPALTRKRSRIASLLGPLGLGLILMLASCAANTVVQPGTAIEQAAGEGARLKVTEEEADKALHDEALAKAAAANAQAEADQAEKDATRSPTPALIAAAADARVRAVNAAATARTATALAEAAQRIEARARSASTMAIAAAAKERKDDAQAADDRAWARTCEWIGLICLLGGVIVGVVLTRVSGLTFGLTVGGTIAGAGELAAAYGQTITWMPLTAVGLFLVGLLLWERQHLGLRDSSAALSKTVDALEGTATSTVDEAKQALAATLNRSGLTKLFDRLRAGWSQDNQETATIPVMVAPAPVTTTPSQPS